MSRDAHASFSAKLGKVNGALLKDSLIQEKLHTLQQISSVTMGADVDGLLVRCGDTPEDISARLGLAESYLMHCHCEGAEGGLNAAIALQCEALRAAHTLDLRSRMIDICLSISESLILSFRRYGAEEDAEDAMKICQFAQSISPRSNSRILARLGSALGYRHRISSKIEGLPVAVSTLRQALDHEDQACTAEDKVSALTVLGQCLYTRFQVTGELADLQESINVARCAVATPCTALHHAEALNFLGCSLLEMFMIGDHSIDMLEEAVTSCRSSVRHSPPHHSESASNLLNLAAVLGVRHTALGNVADLDEVSSLLQNALRVNKSPRRMLPILTNLGDVKFRLCEAYDDWSDIMESIDLLRQALQYCPIGYPRRTYIVSSLISFLVAAHHEKQLGSLDEAIALARQAMEISGSDHPHASTFLTDMCQVLRARGSIADLDEVMPLHKRLLELLPTGFRGHINAKAEWALSLVARFKLTRNIEDFDEASQLINEAIDDHYSSIFLRYRAAFNWVKATTDISSIDLSLGHIPLEAHRKAISLLPRVSYLGFDPHARITALKQGRRLAVDAAMLALSQTNPISAVELLEQGRSIFWTGSLRLRADYNSLPESLSDKILEANRALEKLNQEFPGDATDAKRRVHADQLEDLIAEARALPGHANFLLPRSFSAIKAVASEGPVVVLLGNTCLFEAILLLHEDDSPIRVLLSNVDQGRLKNLNRALEHANIVSLDRKASSGGLQSQLVYDKDTSVSEPSESTNEDKTLYTEPSAERIDRLKLERQKRRQPNIHYNSLLRSLWDDIMGPVLESAGLQNPAADPPRLWLCPTGPFMFLPLHAAQSSSCHYALDCAVISYTPTLTNLLDARERIDAVSEFIDPKVLVVAQPNVPSQVALPQTLEEAAVVQTLVSPRKIVTLSDTATQGDILHTNVDVECARVVGSLSEVSVLHLACHGFQEASRPLDSGFMMHDKRLTVSDLMALKLPKAQFAFLSACQSAMGDRDSPDEAIHLSAAMMFLGFGSIIATMWNMNDADGPSLAREIYGSLFDGNRLDFASIPRALNRAARKLRDDGVHPSRWATYIHMGA